MPLHRLVERIAVDDVNEVPPASEGWQARELAPVLLGP